MESLTDNKNENLSRNEAWEGKNKAIDAKTGEIWWRMKSKLKPAAEKSDRRKSGGRRVDGVEIRHQTQLAEETRQAAIRTGHWRQWKYYLPNN